MAFLIHGLLVRLGLFSLLLMIPLHLLFKHFGWQFLGVAPAVFFLGFSMFCFGAAFVLQFFAMKSHVQELLFGLSLVLGGLSTIGFDYLFTTQDTGIAMALIGFAFIASVFGTMIFGLWSPKENQ